MLEHLDVEPSPAVVRFMDLCAFFAAGLAVAFLTFCILTLIGAFA